MEMPWAGRQTTSPGGTTPRKRLTAEIAENGKEDAEKTNALWATPVHTPTKLNPASGAGYLIRVNVLRSKTDGEGVAPS